MRRTLMAGLAVAGLSCLACGDPAPSDPGPGRISGASLDAVQHNLRVILDRDFGGRRAESVRVEMADEGRRAIVHVRFEEGLGEREYPRLCDALSEASASVLEEGQKFEVHFLDAGSVVHSCGL